VNENKNIYSKYKHLYRDIIFGYTEERFKSTQKKVYIKHLNDLETGQSERKYEDFLYIGKEKGLKTEQESVDFLIEEGLWSKKQESRIPELKDRIYALESAKDRLIIKSQLVQLAKELKPLSDELYILNYERTENVGMTAETFANKKIAEATIRTSFFTNPNLNQLFYTEEEFDYLDQAEVNESLEMYGKMISGRFGGDEIKRVSVCPFFMNAYILCDDNVFTFFGKSLLELTNFQLSLMSHAKYFKTLMSNSKSPPEDYYTSPDKIIEWFELQNKTMEAKSALEDKGEAGGKSLMGASKEELDAVEGDQETVVNLNKKIESAGGEMDFDQILKMHGI